MHGMDVHCSQFLDVTNEPWAESGRNFRISASKRETNERPIELSLTTGRSQGTAKPQSGGSSPYHCFATVRFGVDDDRSIVRSLHLEVGIAVGPATARSASEVVEVDRYAGLERHVYRDGFVGKDSRNSGPTIPMPVPRNRLGEAFIHQ